ncbi:hypothetical protein [Rufibacter roseus]|uniref:1-deoxy-D-xylulose-5-phosphate synthase n=1 Tax=Rufibacter roseus TaxID=1567108 RepID=A0ABW2DM95_9BACT|nr:hypothetical protein [Rufibacter roseus]
MRSRIMYLENKETGEGRIGRISFSRTYQTVCYKGITLHRAGSGKIKGNFFNPDTLEEYWVSGCKKRGGDYHWASKVPVIIDEDVKEEYWTSIRGMKSAV